MCFGTLSVLAFGCNEGSKSMQDILFRGLPDGQSLRAGSERLRYPRIHCQCVHLLPRTEPSIPGEYTANSTTRVKPLMLFCNRIFIAPTEYRTRSGLHP